MSVFSFITEELRHVGLTLKDLNKKSNKELKQSFVKRAIERQTEVTPDERFKNGKLKPKKSTVLNIVRKESGLKFSNSYGRSIYEKAKLIEPRADYGTKLKGNVKPQADKIPLTKKAQTDKNYTIQNEYLYIADVYVRTNPKKHIKFKKKYKLKTFPNKKNYIRLSSGGYMTKEPYTFYSTFPFSKDEVNQIFKDIFSGKSNLIGGMEKYIEQSDVGNVFDSTKTIVGFKYTWLVRN